ncbi:MAG TPA: TrmH family RNA methyltransferase, partial [Gemmatales bacterium]|nr:TrmH family RNA methyltransferase [Gemmatales bacterium]
LLDRASKHATLQEAVADCIWVGATSARTGGLFRKQNVLELKPALSHARSLATQGRVALVFGPEDHGLRNEEISLCHHLLHIHASADYPVLNLAQAVCVCLYEWFQSTVPLHHASEDPPVVFDELNRSLNHLEEALRAIHFIWGEKGDSVAHALRHLLARARPNALENKLLHGLARQILWYVEKHPCKE